MLTCYLDDSGKDPQNSVTTIAGYVARDAAWELFESAVEPWFNEFKVDILHAKELHSTRNNFEGWSKLKKQAFVARVCQARNPHVLMGLTMSAAKDTYKVRAEASSRKRTVTPYTFCFQVIIDWLLLGITRVSDLGSTEMTIGKAVNTEGVAIVIEAGHDNNAEAEQQFDWIRKTHGLGRVLRSISFVSKDSCKAIQLADLLAFYSRRDAVAQLKARQEGLDTYELDALMKVVVENLPHRGYVALDFENPNDRSPFFDFSQFGWPS